MKFDMHCHTKEGSVDARVSIEDYIKTLREKGFNACEDEKSNAGAREMAARCGRAEQKRTVFQKRTKAVRISQRANINARSKRAKHDEKVLDVFYALC